LVIISLSRPNSEILNRQQLILNPLKRAILHSFHSQVPDTVSELDDWFELLVCLDAHVDDHWETQESREGLPEEIGLVALRASAHGALRYRTGKFPAMRGPDDIVSDMTLVVPKTCMITHVAHFENMMSRLGVEDGSKEDPITHYEGLLRDILGIDLFYSPPRDLVKLSNRMKESETCLLDIDVDYMFDMQNECYTPMKKSGPGDLGWSQRVLHLIRKSKPEIITVSEARVSAIRDPKSNFAKFWARLGSLGYVLEKAGIYESDEKAQRALDLYQEYYEKVQVPLQMRNLTRSYWTNFQQEDDRDYRERLA